MAEHLCLARIKFDITDTEHGTFQLRFKTSLVTRFKDN